MERMKHSENQTSKRTILFVVALLVITANLALMLEVIGATSQLSALRWQGATPFPTFPTWYPPVAQTLDLGEWQTQAAVRLTPTITGTVWTFGSISFGYFDTPAPLATDAGTPAGDGVILDSQNTCNCPDSLDKAIGIWVRTDWETVINGQIVVVIAGSQLDDSSQGLLLVLTNADVTDGRRFLTPYPGAVRIIGAQGQRLTLRSDQGQIFYFDVPSLQFTASPDAALPTITPVPLGPSLTPTLIGDAPHQIGDVNTLSPVNTLLHFAIYQPGELEWFAFRSSIPGTIQVHVDNLSVNYDLYVYSTDYSQYHGQSTNLGTTPETVTIPDAPAGIYMVQVASVGGSFDPNHMYRLEFDVSPSTPQPAPTHTATLTLTPSLMVN